MWAFDRSANLRRTSKGIFPWSKPANIVLGEDVKFMVQGNKMTILDDNQKQPKASIVKASVTQAR
jgi:hypothetical protein